MSRRNGSMSRAVEAAAKNRLHMDRNPQHARITDPSNPAGRRKEIDNVMKRARQASPGSWDRKLLEVEEKDPNRWRHTGYKQLYLDGSPSPSPRRSRSPVPRNIRSPILRRSRSPIPRRSRSPIPRRSRSPIPRRSRSPIPRRSRSPVQRKNNRGSRSPVARVPPPLRKSRSRSQRRTPPRRSPRRTPVRRSPVRRRASRPRSPPPVRRQSPRAVRVKRPAPPLPNRQQARPPSPPDPRKSSVSGSSMSSCSDESCSVCSAKNKKQQQPPPPKGVPAKPSRIPSASPARPSKSSGRAVQPTRELLKARESSKRSREDKVLEWQRSQLAVRGGESAPVRVKREGERRRKSAPARPPAPGPAPAHDRGQAPKAGAVSPTVIAAALNDTDSDSETDASSDHHPQRLTLSERFGKMAQWSADRSARLENMRITRREATLHVRIESDGRPMAVDEPMSEVRAAMDPAPVGSYPEELLAVAPGGLSSWDDVRVRYDYYKKRGYLRGLTLCDYVKWEEWWYKYQDWLKRERAYERWAEGDVGTVRRERRRRGGRHKRS